jgi:hypothetical protein
VNIPQALADLLNKTDAGWIVFAHMVPTRIFRITAHESFKTFRVEQFTRTNKDNITPSGTWHTLSTHGSETPGAMLQAACTAALKAQNDFRAKMQKRVEARVVDDEIRKRQLG